jgi:hypothetical protein
MCEKCNTHFYDHKLIPAKDLVPTKWKQFEIDERRKMLEKFCHEKISEPAAKHMIKNIIRDIGAPANYDSTNDNYADEIFANIIYTIDNCTDKEQITSMYEIIGIQLMDMYSGQCAQGRNTRLFQIYNAFCT